MANSQLTKVPSKCMKRRNASLQQETLVEGFGGWWLVKDSVAAAQRNAWEKTPGPSGLGHLAYFQLPQERLNDTHAHRSSLRTQNENVASFTVSRARMHGAQESRRTC